MHSITVDTVLRMIPSLAGVESKLLNETAQLSRLINLKPGQRLFSEGEACLYQTIILKGKIRIQKASSDGREIILNHLEQGQQCSLCNTCLLGKKHYPADAIAETDSECLLVPRQQFYQILDHAPDFRHQLFNEIEHDMHHLIHQLEELAFGHMDQRLATLLLQYGKNENPIHTTHQALATELGTAREVISRLLKGFEHHQYIQLKRCTIFIKQAAALEEISFRYL